MSLLAGAGTFALNTGTGNQTVTISRLPYGSFTPKYLLCWWNGQTTIPGTKTSAVMGWGMGVSSSSRRAVCFGSADNAANTDCSSDGANNALIVYRAAGAAARDVEADLVSFGTDQFTINVSNAGPAMHVGYLALGGTDFDTPFLGSFQAKASTGSQAYTGVGFQGKLFMPFCQAAMAAETASSGSANVAPAFGWATGSGARGYAGGRMINSAAAANTGRRQSTSHVFGRIGTPPNLTDEADFTSFDSDGFTLDWTTIGTGSTWAYYSMFRGAFQCGVGSVTMPTSDGTQLVTLANPRLRPKVVLMQTINNTASSSVLDHHNLGWSCAIEPSSGGVGFTDSLWSGDEDAADPTVSDSAMDDETFGIYTPGTPTAAFAASVDQLNVGSFRLNVTPAPATAVQVLYCVLGDRVTGGDYHRRTQLAA